MSPRVEPIFEDGIVIVGDLAYTAAEWEAKARRAAYQKACQAELRRLARLAREAGLG